MLALFRPGAGELLLILLIVLLVFGATKLPQIGKSLGEAVRGFKKSVSDEKDNSDTN